MAYIKWIKLATCMPDDERMKLIDAIPERDTVHYIWIRLLLQAGRTNSDGEIFLSDDMPYTQKMLATLFSRPLASIKLALKILLRLGMIEIDADKVIRIVNWDKHQNIEGMERVREQNRKRAENHREKKKLEKKAAKNNNEEISEDLEDNKDLEEANEIKGDEHSQESNDAEKNKSVEEQKDDLVTSEKDSGSSNDRDAANVVTSETIINNIEEASDTNYNSIKNISNVTQNESNVTVTEQNKKEIENKKKNKKEKREIDKDTEIDKNIESYKNNTCEENNKSSACDDKLSQSSLFDNNTKSEFDEDINLKAMELMKYHEKITGKIGGCDSVALRSAINIYGEKMVKKAMDVGFERNCPEIKYAIGVLKNWKREGYPEDEMEVKKNGFRNLGKSNTADKNEFAGFKPKEPRKLTDAERKRAEANLI